MNDKIASSIILFYETSANHIFLRCSRWLPNYKIYSIGSIDWSKDAF